MIKRVGLTLTESYDILEQAWINLQPLEPLETLSKRAERSAASTIEKLIIPPVQTIPYDLSKLSQKRNFPLLQRQLIL